MTGEKNRFGKFDDDDFKDPTHDEIIVRLLDYENMQKTVPITKFSLDEIVWLTRSRDKIKLVKTGDSGGYGYFWEMPTGEFDHTVCKPITDLVRYDMVSDSVKIYSEKPIMRVNSIIGYWDLVFMRYAKLQRSKNTIISKFTMVRVPPEEIYISFGVYIEVKPKIDSFGKVLRQLKSYEKYEPPCVDMIYLVTPDLRFKNAFENQGIKVINPNEGDKK